MESVSGVDRYGRRQRRNGSERAPECREQQLPLPPIEAMRCRSEATKTKRCAVGKNEAMRCRFAREQISFRKCQPTAHRFVFSDSASLRVGQTRADSASLRLVPVMKSSHRGAPASPLTPSGVESSVSHGRRPLRESLDIRALPPSRRPRPSRERQTGVTGRFPVRRAEPTFLPSALRVACAKIGGIHKIGQMLFRSTALWGGGFAYLIDKKARRMHLP